MKKILTRPVIYTLYTMTFILLFIGLIMFSNQSKSLNPTTPNGVIDVLNKLTIPVINKTEMKIGRPYMDEGITIVQNYYDYRSPEAEQKKSLIYFQGTYLQSKGVSYQLAEAEGFYVLAVLDGEVTEVKTDELVGNRITIKHSENIYSVYQSLAEINVSVGDQVDKGMVIGKSGTANINSTLKNHLYFELLIDNIYVNPEEYYDKTL